MEWLQLILWVMAVTIKLALYFYAMTRLLGGEARQENAAANLGPFYVYLLLMPTVCLLLRGLDVDAALRWRSAFTWGFVLLAWIGGAAAWLCPKIPALLLKVLLCGLLLCGCGGQRFPRGKSSALSFLHSRVNTILSACC